MYPDRDTIVQLLPTSQIKQHDFAKWLLKGKSKYIAKHLLYGPLGKLFSFVFLLNSRENKTIHVYVIEWSWKIFPRLKNKAFRKRLKRWVEFLLFALCPNLCCIKSKNVFFKIIDWWIIIDNTFMSLISSSQIYASHLLVTSESKHVTIGKLTAVLPVKLFW